MRCKWICTSAGIAGLALTAAAGAEPVVRLELVSDRAVLTPGSPTATISVLASYIGPGNPNGFATVAIDHIQAYGGLGGFISNNQVLLASGGFVGALADPGMLASGVGGEPRIEGIVAGQDPPEGPMANPAFTGLLTGLEIFRFQYTATDFTSHQVFFDLLAADPGAGLYLDNRGQN